MSVSYAQNFEDVVLWRALQDVEKGFYIDIGAQDPVVSSVSLAFYEKGWRGVHVEPSGPYAAALRAARPDETVFEVAIGRGDRVVTLYEVPDSGLTSGEADVAERAAEAGFFSHEVEVPTLSLAALLSRYADRPIHWLKVDVEGMEADVIGSWGDCPVRPWILVVESVMPLGRATTHAEWEHLVLERGYQLAYWDGLNRFYAIESRPELIARLKDPPNVFDNWHLSGSSGNPFAALLEQSVRRFEQQAEGCERQQLLLRERLAARIDPASMPLHSGEAHDLLALVDAVGSRLDGISARCEQLEGELSHEQLQRAVDATSHSKESSELRHEAARLAGELQQTAASCSTLGQQLSERVARETDHRNELARVRGELDTFQSLSRSREDRLTALCEALQAESMLRLQTFEETRARDDSEWRRTLQEAQDRQDRFVAERDAAIADLRRTEAARMMIEEQLLAAQAALHDLEARLGRLEIESATASQKSAAAVQQLESTLSSARLEIVGQRAAAQSDAVRAQAALVSLQATLANVRRSAFWRLGEVFGIAPSVATPSPTRIPGIPLAALLSLDDVEFVRSAYRTVLRREPDPTGEVNCLNLLRAGLDRETILADMLLSPEGQQVGSVIHGLGPKLWRRRLRRRLSGRPVERAQILQPAMSGSRSASANPDAMLPIPSQIPSRKETLLLQEMLNLHDVAFVRAAYRLILGREADPSGERNYVNLLRQGHDKVRLLGEISSSDEARARGVEVPGLARALRRRRLAAIPALGPFGLWLGRVLRPGSRLDPEEAFRHQVIGMQQATMDLVSQLIESTKELEQRQIHLEGVLGRSGGRVGEVRRFRG